MSLLVNIRSNYLATAVEACSLLVGEVVKTLLQRNCRYERRRQLFRFGEVRDVLRHQDGVRNTVDTVRTPRSTNVGRLLAVVSSVLWVLSFVTGPALQSQINPAPVVDEGKVSYRTIRGKSICRGDGDTSFVSSFDSQRSILESYEYAMRHGLGPLSSGQVPNAVDTKREESIRANTFNSGTQLRVTSDKVEDMLVRINDNSKLGALFSISSNTNLIEQWRDGQGWEFTGRWFQKANATYFKLPEGRWDAKDADAMIGLAHKEHSEYKVVIIDTRRHRRLQEGNYQMPVRVADLSFSAATPWPNKFQELMLVLLHSRSFDSEGLIGISAYVLALHWASVTGQSCERDMLVPRVYSEVSKWALFGAMGVVGLLVVMLLITLLLSVMTRKMPNLLDDPHRALSSCYRELNGLGDSTERTQNDVKTVEDAQGYVRATWRQNTGEHVAIQQNRSQFFLPVNRTG